jgi:putative cardiolipin synthase
VPPARAAYHEASAVFDHPAERGAMHSRIVCFALAVLFLASGASGCGSLPQVERKESHALLVHGGSRLERLVQARLAVQPGLTGAYPLADGTDAFGARVGLVRAAARTLDVQYYILEPDETGFAFLAELLSAADRGVRVRLLLDDIHTAGLQDMLAAAASHPNIEVRLFNPFVHRRARWLDALTDLGRISRRMHNKSLTADNAVTIVGGRNIGGEYFGVKPDLDFSDLDLLTVGPVVAQVSAQFDRYWNSQQAYPIAALVDARRDGLRALRGELGRAAMRHPGGRFDAGQGREAQAIVQGQLPPFFWGAGTVIADPPEKVVQPLQDSERHVASGLLELLGQARAELILVSPYFVPGERGVRWLQGLVRRGVRVEVITNSFAATDVTAVHAGYARYREVLLRSGIVLYEMKPSAQTVLARQSRRGSQTGPSRSSLHAKAYMRDRHTVVVGSFNLDHRSAHLNTEMGVVVGNEALCASLYDDFVRKILDVAYRVELAGDASGGRRLAWVTREGAREVRYDKEPGVGAFDKAYLELLERLPIEDQL